MIPEKFLRCCVKWCSTLSMSKVFHWGECFPVSLVCLFLCRMWFSWMALRENKVFHLRKVISSGLALALFPSDSRWKPQDSEHVVWFGESHSAHFWLGEDGLRCLSRDQAAWNEASLFIHKLHSSSLPPPPQQATFFILFVPPAWILNTFLKELASTCSTGQLYPFCGFSLVPTPVLRNSASPGNDIGKALFLQIQKRQESSWLFSKALPEKGCQNKTVLFCHVRSWKVVKGLENPTPREKCNLRSENLLPKSRDIKAWMDSVICDCYVHQASPEVHTSQACPFSRERPHCFVHAHTSQWVTA